MTEMLLSAEDTGDEPNWWKSADEIIDALYDVLIDEDIEAIGAMNGPEAIAFLLQTLSEYGLIELNKKSPEEFLMEKGIISLL